ncbi:MAG: YIP1 family protein [Hyphomonadaceae bacterium]|nr:YIP1 family protein [Hyphomonadaceae bacterium]
MTVVEPAGGGAPGIVDRAKNILFQPGSEWDRIKGENTPLASLLTGYILPLAALSAICGVIGMSIFGYGMFGISVKVPIVSAVVTGAVQVCLTMLGVFLLGLLINALAPSFGSTADQGQANKLAAYSMTASLLAGVFTIFPPIAILGILGLYSLGLLYMGLPRLMNTPADKRVGYFATILIIWIVGALVIGWAIGAARMAIPGAGLGGFAFNHPAAAPATDDVTIKLPGGVTINSGEAEKAAKQMEQALAGAQVEGGGKAIDVAALSALLPASLPGGFTRTETSSGSGGMGGFNIGNAEAIYTRGDSRLTLTVTDTGAAGALAGLAAAANVQSSRQTATGYERTQTVNGRMVTEEVDTSARTAHYQVMSTNRIMVSAQGSNVTIEEAQGAVNSVLGPAEALARAN